MVGIFHDPYGNVVRMKTSSYMILFYASMIAVPFLFVLETAFLLFGYLKFTYAVETLTAVGLLIYCILGFAEIYSYKKDRTSVLMREISVPAKQARLEYGRGEKILDINIKRFNQEGKRLESQSYKVKANRFTTVLDALLSIKSEQDNSLALRYSCRMGICGSCSMVVNGKPSLACETPLLDTAKNNGIQIEPMQAHPLLKDLVTDFDDFFAKHKDMRPGLYRKNRQEQSAAKSIYQQSKEERDMYLPFSYCIMCGLCQDACPVANSNKEFAGPQALSQIYRYAMDSRDQMGAKRLNLANSLEGAWGCEFAGACSEVCPKGVDPAAAIQSLKFKMFDGVPQEKETKSK